MPYLPGLRAEVPFESYGLLLMLFVPAWILCAAHFRLHRVPVVLGPYLGIFRALLRTQLGGVVAIAVMLVGLQVVVNRSLIAAFVLVSTAMLLLSKSVQRWIALSRREQEVALLLGEADESRIREIQGIRGRSVEVMKDVSPDRLRARLQDGGIHEVVIPP